MSLSPQNLPLIIDLVDQGGLSGTAVGTGTPVSLPAGKKAIQVSLPTSATATIKVQNSLDKVTWFDVSSSTVATQGAVGGSFIAEIESGIPHWRAIIPTYTTSTLPLVARIAITVPS